MRILIIEDQDLYRCVLAESLLKITDVSNILEANSIETARNIISKQASQLDLILLDQILPDGHGIDFLIEIKTMFPSTTIAIMSACDDTELMQQALHAGAHGFIPKVIPTPIFLTAIKLILAGGTYIHPDLYDRTLPSQTAKKYGGSTLTKRQQEVLNLICDGLSNKLIAYQLNITEATVKAHITVILKHYAVSSRFQLLLKCNHE